MAMAAHNDEGTNTRIRHDVVRVPGITDVLLLDPWASGPPAPSRRGSRWA